MTIQIVTREVTPLIATKWYVKKLIEEVPLAEKRSKEIGINLPIEFVTRQTTDIIADCIRRVQCLYSWEKNSYTGILYREESFNEIINNVLDTKSSLSSLKNKVGERSTVEHVIPVAHFKDKLFNLNKENRLNEIDIIKSFLSPVALIDKFHTNKENNERLKNSYYEEKYPFRRYINSGIKIFTHDGYLVDNQNWTIEDHWDLLKRTEYFNLIMQDLFKN
ncbi:MAG: hypothetical protein U0354_15550 [Candidatus Sericytochromatia bacterium]